MNKQYGSETPSGIEILDRGVWESLPNDPASRYIAIPARRVIRVAALTSAKGKSLVNAVKDLREAYPTEEEFYFCMESGGGSVQLRTTMTRNEVKEKKQ